MKRKYLTHAIGCVLMSAMIAPAALAQEAAQDPAQETAPHQAGRADALPC